MKLNAATDVAAELPGADVRATLCAKLLWSPKHPDFRSCVRLAGHAGAHRSQSRDDD